VLAMPKPEMSTFGDDVGDPMFWLV